MFDPESRLRLGGSRLDVLWNWLPFSIPVFYLVLIFSLQPSNRLGAADWPSWLGRLVYDDYDLTAFALRGLNIELGRTPGRPDDPCTNRKPIADITAANVGDATEDGPFYLEYPPSATLLFRVPFWLPPQIELGKLRSGIPEACHNEIVEHLPSDTKERLIWLKFRQATRVYATGGVLCLIGLMLVMYAGYLPDGGLRGPMPLLILPAALYFSANRFDIVPAFFMALSFAALGRGRMASSAACLGLSTMLKVYPGLAAFLIIRFLGGRRRDLLTWCAVYVLTLVVTLTPSLVAWGWDGTMAAYKVQFSRTAEALSFYGHILPTALGDNTWWAQAFRLGTVLSMLAVVSWWQPHNLQDLLRRAAIVLIVFVSLQVFYSPQWILWLMPLLLPLAGTDRTMYALVVAFDVLTYVTFPVAFDSHKETWLGILIYLRAGFLVALVARLASTDVRSRDAA